MNYKMIIEYDGSKYKGWQRLKTDHNTIQEKIETALSKQLEQDITIEGSGRTDAGVHAFNQVASFETDFPIDTHELQNKLNQFLPNDIVIKSISSVRGRFHARLNAESKVYTYTIWRGSYRPVLDRAFVGDYTGVEMDLAKMQAGALLLTGKHDFKGFSSDKTKKSTVREIESIEIEEAWDKIIIRFKGNGFLYNMVRILVGTLVEIGTGQRELATINQIFEKKQRADAGETAPASGLCLTKVHYK